MDASRTPRFAGPLLRAARAHGARLLVGKVTRVSGAPDIYTVTTQQPASDGPVTIRLSPGLQAYSFTSG